MATVVVSLPNIMILKKLKPAFKIKKTYFTERYAFPAYLGNWEDVIKLALLSHMVVTGFLGAVTPFGKGSVPHSSWALSAFLP